jgi:hypothetical protein
MELTQQQLQLGKLKSGKVKVLKISRRAKAFRILPSPEVGGDHEALPARANLRRTKNSV